MQWIWTHNKDMLFQKFTYQDFKITFYWLAKISGIQLFLLYSCSGKVSCFNYSKCKKRNVFSETWHNFGSGQCIQNPGRCHLPPPPGLFWPFCHNTSHPPTPTPDKMLVKLYPGQLDLNLVLVLGFFCWWLEVALLISDIWQISLSNFYPVQSLTRCPFFTPAPSSPSTLLVGLSHSSFAPLGCILTRTWSIWFVVMYSAVFYFVNVIMFLSQSLAEISNVSVLLKEYF